MSKSGASRERIIAEASGELLRSSPPKELARLAESLGLNPGCFVHRQAEPVNDEGS